MKLWARLLFAHGYLWRDRMPEFWSARDTDNWSPHVFDTLRALALGIIGVFLAVIESAIFAVLVPMAATVAIAHGDSFGLKRFFGSRAFWLSVNWAAGALSLAAMAGVLVFALARGHWLIAAPIFVFWAFGGTEMLRDAQRHYLFFAGRRPYVHPPDDEGEDRADMYIETYWLLPRQILFGIEPRRQPPEGGTA